MRASLGLRKGAWTEEEDALLQKCVQRHGEGRWHLVPSRAGLNRCRRSCRLRWLNYLKPDIKRGAFEDDEVDMIVRLHKLLGNRWSLIAGRIPGRTANDVKNYWNSHLAKRVTSTDEKTNEKPQKTIKISALKPRARTFSKGLAWLRGKATLITSASLRLENNITDTEVAWWEGSLSEADDFGRSPASAIPSADAPLTRTAAEEAIRSEMGDDISLDIDIWQLWDTTPQPSV